MKAEWYILAATVKWLDGKSITLALPDYPKWKEDKQNDSKLLKDLWQYLDAADIVIAHNGDEFDIKRINGRFLYHGMQPPSPYRTIDTLKVAKQRFFFNRNKLEYLANYLGIGAKVKTGGMELWLGCMSGDAQSWNKMRRYNKRDVLLLEAVYKKLRPWMKNHPNLAMYEGHKSCPRCGSTKIQWRGIQVNQTTQYRRFQCKSCGGWGRAQKREPDTTPLVTSL